MWWKTKGDICRLRQQSPVGVGHESGFGTCPNVISKWDRNETLCRVCATGGFKIGDFKPVVGFLVTDDSAKYGYAGVRLDYKLANNSVLISPSFTPGVYGKGDGKDLGHSIEFKTQVRAALNLSSTSNIGVSYSHISNASLGDKNPGANNYSISFQKNF